MDIETNSVTLHRVLKATPEKIYRAFTESNALTFWLPPYGFLCVVHEIDVRVGGSYKMSFINFSTGNGHSFGGNSGCLIDSSKHFNNGKQGTNRNIKSSF